MAQFDAHPVLAYSTVQTAPVPPSSGTTLTVQAGDGVYFSSPPFNMVVWPSGAEPAFGNAEIVRCTGRSGDTLSISRGQEGTTQRSIAVGWQISAAITPKSLNDIQTQLLPLTGGTLQPEVDSSAVFATRRSAGAGGSTLFQIDTDTPLITSAAPFLMTGPQQQVYAGTAQGSGFLAEVWDGPGTNLVPNPTFESGTTNWIAGSGYSATQSTAAAKSGAASLELSKPATGGTISGITDQVNSVVSMTATPTGIAVSSIVIIRDVVPDAYNGLWLVTAVTGNTFTINNSTALGAYSGGPGTVIPAGNFGDVIVTSSAMPISSSTDYVLSWFDRPRVPGTANYWLVDLVPDNSSVVTFYYPYGTGNSTEWWRHSLAWTSGPSDTSVQIRIRLSADNIATDGYIDAVQFEQGLMPSSYLDGSLGYGYSWTGSPNSSPSARVGGHRLMGQVGQGSQSWLDVNGEAHSGRSWVGNQARYDCYGWLNIHTLIDPNQYVSSATGRTNSMGLYVYAGYSATGSKVTTAMEGVDVTAFVDTASTANYSLVQGTTGVVAHFGSGTIDWANAVVGQIQYYGGATGTITNAVDLRASGPLGGSVGSGVLSNTFISSLYGLLVDSLNLGASNIYGIYVNYPSQSEADPATYTDGVMAALYIPSTSVGMGSAASATTSQFFGVYVGQPTLSSSANVRTVTQAASLCIAGPPTTIDSSVVLEGTVYSLIVENGSSKFAGEVAVSTSTQFPLYVDTAGCTIAGNAGVIVTGNSANAGAGIQYAFQAALVQNASNAAGGGSLVGFCSDLIVASGIDLGSSVNFLSLDTTLQGSGTVANDIGMYIVQPSKGSISNVGLVIGVAPVSGTYSLYGSSGSPYLFAGQVQPSNSNPPWAATMNVAVNTANTYTISQTGNTMLSVTSVPQVGTPIWFRISSDSTSRTATLGAGFLLQGSSNVSPSATKSVYMSFISNGSALVELSRSISL